MKIALFIYLAEHLETFKMFFEFSAFMASFILFVFFILSKIRGSGIKFKPIYMLPVSILILFALLTPKSKTMYLMGGAYLAEKAVANIHQSEEYKKLIELFNLEIDKRLKELKGNLKGE